MTKPSDKRKFTTAAREYRDTFLRRSSEIAETLEFGNTISESSKRNFIEANHKHKTADHLQWLLDGEK